MFGSNIKLVSDNDSYTLKILQEDMEDTYYLQIHILWWNLNSTPIHVFNVWIWKIFVQYGD